MGPHNYEIRVAGVVPDSVLIEIEDMRVIPIQVHTVISAQVPDQAALHGIINRLQRLCPDLLEVRGSQQEPRLTRSPSLSTFVCLTSAASPDTTNLIVVRSMPYTPKPATPAN